MNNKKTNNKTTVTYTKATVIWLACAVFFGLVVMPSTTEAACSYNGFINSNGKCAKSWNNSSWEKRVEKERDDFESRIYDVRRQMLERQIAQLMLMIERLEEQRDGFDSSDDDLDVTTRSAINIEENEATLRGRIIFDEDADEAEVWFEYGTSRYDLDEETDKEDIDEGDSEYFSIDIDDLKEGETYYFRAVAEDEDGNEDYGSTLSFRTDGNSDDEPVATTRSARDIEDDEVELRGEVDMNDFDDGIVFFVYGEDENDIDDVENDFDSYTNVDENGDDLQKVLIDSNHDGSDTFTRTVTGLDDATNHYFRICVEYEDEDSDETLTCGSVLDFRTDD